MATAARPRPPPEPEPRYHPATGRNTFQWGGPTFRHPHPARHHRRHRRRRHSGPPSLRRRPKSGKVCLESGRHHNAGKLKPPNRKPCSRRQVAFLLGGLIPTVIPAGGLIPTVIPVGGLIFTVIPAGGLIFTVIPDIYRHSGASRNPGIPNFSPSFRRKPESSGAFRTPACAGATACQPNHLKRNAAPAASNR